MTTTSAIITDINNFVSDQNANRGGGLAGGGTLPLDFNALTGTLPSGDNAVTGISGIAAGAPAITLPVSMMGNAVIVDGGISTTASTGGADSYSLLVATGGAITLTDNNTGNSESITGATYVVFDGGAKVASGAYQSAEIIATGMTADIASMYNAAFERVPDFAGLEYYAIPISEGKMTLEQAAGYLLGSPEFTKLYPALTALSDSGGPNDQAFISELYGQILHRTPVASEIVYYVDALEGKLTTGTGASIPAADRADLLIYFSISPENQSDIAASNGGWLINPTSGAVNLGTLSTATATSLLTSEAASGTINTSDFTGLSSSASIGAGTDVGITGGEVGAGTANQQSDAAVYVSASNVTVNLSSEYILGVVYGANDTVNSAPTGGSIIDTASSYPAAASVNNGGIVNLSGHQNWIEIGNPIYTVSVATVVNGFDSTDVIVRWGNAVPSFANTAASLLANPAAVVLQGSASSPVNGASYAGTSSTESQFVTTQFAVNVGSITNDSSAAMAVAANHVYKVGDVFTNDGSTSLENILFFGQDPQGNTMIWYWQGDTTHAGTVLASDITGGVELVGVQANSLTSANFHH